MLGMLCGTILGIGVGTGFKSASGTPAEDELSTKAGISIYTSAENGNILKTFRTANGKISFNLNALSQKSIDEIVFYKEAAECMPVNASQIAAIYKMVNVNNDNIIELEETKYLNTVFRKKYYAKACREAGE